MVKELHIEIAEDGLTEIVGGEKSHIVGYISIRVEFAGKRVKLNNNLLSMLLCDTDVQKRLVEEAQKLEDKVKEKKTKYTIEKPFTDSKDLEIDISLDGEKLNYCVNSEVSRGSIVENTRKMIERANKQVR